MRSLTVSGYALHGTTLALAAFFIVNVLVSAALAVGATRLTRRSTSTSANIWFALRLLPAAASTTFVLVLFVPSYWMYEPLESGEGFDLTLTICAGAAIAILALSCARGASAWVHAARRTRAWMRTARPLQLDGASVPAYEIAAEAPVMAIVGILRSRLLVTRGLVAALTPEELSASVAHEMSHSRGRDNLKRLLMRAAPDVFNASAAAGAIEQLWAASAEHRADNLASGIDPTRRCALASALVKVARLRPARTPMAEPISTLVGGGDIASRVHRLLGEPTETVPSTNAASWIASAAVLAATAVLYTSVIRAVHEITEILVRALP
jgi:Zn-dependent protease with chaperone function